MTETRNQHIRWKFFVLCTMVSVFCLLQSCALLKLGQGPTPNTYTLTPKSTYENLVGYPIVPTQLVVDRPFAPSVTNTPRIALLKTPMKIEYFANTQWTDRLPAMVQTLLIESFENSGKLPAVGRYGANLRAQFVLQTTIREFQADYCYGKPPKVHVHLVTKLIYMPERRIIDVYSSEAKVQATKNTMSCIVTAFDEAAGRVFKDIVTHTIMTLARLPQRPTQASK